MRANRRKAFRSNPTTLPQLLQLSLTVGTGGSHVPVLDQSSGDFRMLTRPVIFTEKLPTLGTTGDILLADFSQYAIGMGRSEGIERSAHVGFATDETAWRLVSRLDGQGLWESAYTPSAGDSQSWVVSLATRS